MGEGGGSVGVGMVESCGGGDCAGVLEWSVGLQAGEYGVCGQSGSMCTGLVARLRFSSRSDGIDLCRDSVFLSPRPLLSSCFAAT